MGVSLMTRPLVLRVNKMLFKSMRYDDRDKLEKYIASKSTEFIKELYMELNYVHEAVKRCHMMDYELIDPIRTALLELNSVILFELENRGERHFLDKQNIKNLNGDYEDYEYDYDKITPAELKAINDDIDDKLNLDF